MYPPAPAPAGPPAPAPPVSRRQARRPALRRARLAVAGLGAFLLVAGLLLRLYAAPRLIAAPANLYQKDVLTAHDATYFDEGALVSRRGVTLTYTSTVRGDPTASTGNIAVWDSYSVLADRAHHVQVNSMFQRSAFNRHTGLLVNCCGASINDDTRVRQYGIGMFWPIPTHRGDYQVYDISTQRTWPAVYTGTARIGGLVAYRFAQHIPPTLVQQLPGVPTSLLGLRGPVHSVLADRYYQAANTFWVDPRTGVVLDAHERIRSVLHGPGGRGTLVAAAADLRMTPASRSGLLALAKQSAAAIATVRTTGPLAGGIGGLVLILAGTVRFRRGRRRLPG